VFYSLWDGSGGASVWRKRIPSGYEGRVGDAVLGVQSERFANKGAAREDIRLLLGRLSRLES
jgi:hypothetical protein